MGNLSSSGSRRWSGAFPLRVLRQRHRRGGGGAGSAPGGEGIERDLQVLDDDVLALLDASRR